MSYLLGIDQSDMMDAELDRQDKIDREIENEIDLIGEWIGETDEGWLYFCNSVVDMSDYDKDWENVMRLTQRTYGNRTESDLKELGRALCAFVDQYIIKISEEKYYDDQKPKKIY